MTVAGDIGPAPMIKVGAEAPLRRKKPLKGQGKMKSFKEYALQEKLEQDFKNIVEKIGMDTCYSLLESSSIKLDHDYIRKNNMRDRVTVTDFGGGIVYFNDGKKDKKLKMSIFKGQYIDIDELELKEGELKSIEVFLRDMGFKIKDEKASFKTKELIFFKEGDANDAYTDLSDFNYIKKFNVQLKGKSIIYNL
jgi:hypothetical protein